MSPGGIDRAGPHDAGGFGSKQMIRRTVAFAAIAFGLVLTACNTIEGVGRDVESVGDTIADEAE